MEIVFTTNPIHHVAKTIHLQAINKYLIMPLANRLIESAAINFYSADSQQIKKCLHNSLMTAFIAHCNLRVAMKTFSP
jgi:hypothetical protein